MKPSDIRVEAVEVTFQDEKLAVPLRLSKGVIEEITYVRVALHAVNRSGQTATGQGAILLSDLWAFPGTEYSHAQKDAALRHVCNGFGQVLAHDDAHDEAFGDAMQKGIRLEASLPELLQRAEEASGALAPGAIPYLAGLNAMSPFDAALHDAWGKLIGRPSYACYTDAWLNDDLGVYLGPALTGQYPGAYMAHPRRRLAVQHVVGVGDPLTPDEAAAAGASGSPQTPSDLASWIRRDGVFAFKLKTKGANAVDDAKRVADVYRVACATLAERPHASAARLSIDPNEGCAHPDILLEMLDYLATHAPAALDALDYIEQPTGRDLSQYDFTLHDVARRKPVIIDESLERLETLHMLAEQGWSGLAVKTCKGHTHSLLAYCWAKHHNWYVTLQDLTNPGLALVHSANLCAHLALAVPYFECNQRQFMPASCGDEQARFPAYFRVEEGYMTLPSNWSASLPEHRGSGLY